MSQQPKNDLINKYLGLEIFRDRYDYAKKKFNDINAQQKLLGDPKEIEELISIEKKSLEENEKQIKLFDLEKIEVEKEIEKYDNKILELTKKLIKVEKTNYKNVEDANKVIVDLLNKNNKSNESLLKLEDWLSKNFKKEIPEKINLNIKEIQDSLEKTSSSFNLEKQSYIKIDKWLKENPKKEEIDVEPINKSISEIEKALESLESKLLISKGKKCPTCNNVEQVPNKELENKCIEDIKRGNIVLLNKNKELKTAKEVEIHNKEFDKQELELGKLKNSLETKKINIQKIKDELEISSLVKDKKEHNLLVESNSFNLSRLRKEISSNESIIKDIEKEIIIIKSNENSIKANEIIEKSIKDNEFEKKGSKLRIHQLNEKNTELKSSIKVSTNNVNNYEEKLETIKNAKNAYSKYVIYLQAVHRDGIPARIIKNKLPIINYKINSILKNLVDFKVEMTIKPNGDIKEFFYFNSMEKDSLPMSMASGSQKFIGSVAIRDSLHFVSSLTKPSLCIIDEGFGALDDELTIAMSTVFSYLKSKYKNTWIITHKNEIKDFVDNIIQVSKSNKGLTEEQIKDNPKAGISIFDIQK
jgi:DNA repair exonuclease SbcCD ATPase subunit